jgi:hypothetical protein
MLDMVDRVVSGVISNLSGKNEAIVLGAHDLVIIVEARDAGA